MIRIRQIKVNLDSNNIKEKILSRLKIKNDELIDYKINKRSIDARFKPILYYIYEVDVTLKNEDKILKNNKDKDILRTPIDNYSF